MRAIASPTGALAALALLLTAAFAPSSSAGPAFHDLKEAHGCSFLISDPRESGYHTLRAECDWPKVAAARVERVLVDLRGWDATFSHLSRSVVIKEDEGQPVVLRVGYTGKGFPDQSADLSVTQERRGETLVLSWTKAPQQLSDDLVIEIDTGRFEVSPAPSGGTRLIFERSFEPTGGGVVAKSGETGATLRLIEELYLRATSISAG